MFWMTAATLIRVRRPLPFQCCRDRKAAGLTPQNRLRGARRSPLSTIDNAPEHDDVAVLARLAIRRAGVQNSTILQRIAAPIGLRSTFHSGCVYSPVAWIRHAPAASTVAQRIHLVDLDLAIGQIAVAEQVDVSACAPRISRALVTIWASRAVSMQARNSLLTPRLHRLISRYCIVDPGPRQHTIVRLD
jgi:hypothetical protein